MYNYDIARCTTTLTSTYYSGAQRWFEIPLDELSAAERLARRVKEEDREGKIKKQKKKPLEELTVSCSQQS